MRVLLLVPPNKNNENVVRDLLYGCWCKGKRIGGTSLPPLSLMQIAAVLKQDFACDVQMIDAASIAMSQQQLCFEIKGYDTVILSTSAMTWQDDLFVLADLKKTKPELKIILFGYYATYNSEYLLSFSEIDIIVRYEPEYIIRDLLACFKDNLAWQKTKGIAFIENDKYLENMQYPFIEYLDELPFADRTMLSEKATYFNPVIKKMPYTLMLTSRGCCGKCVFCTSPIFYGNKVRYRSVQNVIQELRSIKNMGYKEVFFRDEIFTFSKKRIYAICEQMIEEKLDLKWVCSTRADFLDRDLMQTMKSAGCHMLRMGVESGNQHLLDVAKKGIDLGQIKNVFKWAKKLKINTHAHLVVGIPGESTRTIKASQRFIREIDPTIVTYGVLIPYQGTELFKNLGDNNAPANAAINNNVSEVLLSEHLTDFTREELQKKVRMCYLDFYLRPRYVFRRLFDCRSFEEFKRILFAAKNVISFIFGKES